MDSIKIKALVEWLLILEVILLLWEDNKTQSKRVDSTAEYKMNEMKFKGQIKVAVI
jgi:hypothetical protein